MVPPSLMSEETRVLLEYPQRRALPERWRTFTCKRMSRVSREVVMFDSESTAPKGQDTRISLDPWTRRREIGWSDFLSGALLVCTTMVWVCLDYGKDSPRGWLLCIVCTFDCRLVQVQALVYESLCSWYSSLCMWGFWLILCGDCLKICCPPSLVL